MLNLLALETSGKSGSVSLLQAMEDSEGNEFKIESEQLDPAFGSAKTLAPAIDRLLNRLALDPSCLTAIALLSGPGSFTGLRVGTATAKAMAYALSIPIVEVDTLDAIAFQNRLSTGSMHVVLDAYRRQVFHAYYRFENGGEIIKTTPTQVLDIEVLIAMLAAEGATAASQVVGPGCDRMRKSIMDEDLYPNRSVTAQLDRVRWVEGLDAHPQAASVAILGYSKWQKQETTDPFQLLPLYYRGSAAEEVANRKG
jgi:tRNA threonylcarbamoyladenosine biosynthesis protein TsaB